jgi:hypothetical protein
LQIRKCIREPAKEAGKAHVREAFRRFASSFFQREFGGLGNKQLHEGLLRFYISEIQNKLAQPISEDEFQDGFVDAGGDLGADVFHRDDDTVLIVQAKDRGCKSAVDLNDVLHFKTIFDRLLNGSFNRNSKLAEILSDVDFHRDRFVLKFVTLGKLLGQAEEESKTEPRFPMGGLSERTEFQFLAEDDLTSQLVSSFDTHKSALFSLNIRNYLGNTATNQGIIRTLKSEPSRFYYYNNGVACLAEELCVNETNVEVKNLQVINGHQALGL